MNQHLLEIQRKLEADMQTKGIDYYRSEVSKAIEQTNESTTLYGILAMKKSVDSVTKCIDEFLDDAFTGKAGRLSSAGHLLSLLDPEVAAYLSLKSVIDSVSKNQTLTKCAMGIAGMLEDQFKFSMFEEQEPHWFRRIQKDVNKRTSNRYFRRYAIIHTMNKKALIDHEPWSKQEKMHLGCKLVDLIIQSTGLVELTTHTFGRTKRVLYLTPTEKTMEWIDRINARGEILAPRYMPCVIPPRDWTSPTDGGYHTRHIRPLPLIKTVNRRYLEEMEHHEMPEEYTAINALQKTKWAVNKPILEVMKTVWESGDSWGGLPQRDPLPLPPTQFPNKPKSEMTEAERVMFKEWKHAAARVHQSNSRLTSKRLQLVRTMSMADKFKDFDEFYFVWQNDFRGRKYVVSSFLSPQGPDYAKALLTFANGVPLTSEGIYWLGVHGANCFGEDKVSFDDRAYWVSKNTDAIEACAEDPYENTWWTKASDPWMFLAFCFEWRKAAVGRISHLPVSLDGSNNGLQHLSAINLDMKGGESTNLVPCEIPRDIYQDVADEVNQVLESRKSHDAMAREWLEFGVTRKCTKRPVMVVPYGGKIYSTRQYIEDYITDRIEEGTLSPWGHDLFEPSHYLADIVWACISKVITAARTVMDWLQEISSIISAENLPVIWETPTGFLVHQMYPETRSRRITTHIDNSLIKPQVREQNYMKSDRRRAVNGASPNFIHSLDSAAMTFTINNCVGVGITDFAMVHDSYGVHASLVPKLYEQTRASFVRMYEQNDVLEQFKGFALEVVDEVPTPPQKGSLDLSLVKESKYFFA
tara:strand:- start:7101 stop:9527 length:2427 start_codon:yes stop_codon:yes gene_type:complete